MCTVTISSGAGSFAQGQIPHEKNCVVTDFVSSHPRELLTSLLLQCLLGSLASYCVVFSTESVTVQ